MKNKEIIIATKCEVKKEGKDNGISITSGGLAYKNGDFFNEHSNIG